MNSVSGHRRSVRGGLGHRGVGSCPQSNRAGGEPVASGRHPPGYRPDGLGVPHSHHPRRWAPSSACQARRFPIPTSTAPGPIAPPVCGGGSACWAAGKCQEHVGEELPAPHLASRRPDTGRTAGRRRPPRGRRGRQRRIGGRQRPVRSLVPEGPAGRPVREPLPRAPRCTAVLSGHCCVRHSLAARVTASGVKPNLVSRSFSGAEVPNVSMPTTTPRVPT